MTEDETMEMMRLIREVHAAVTKPGVVGPVMPMSDAELDSEYGNFIVHRDPKRWTGQSYAGRRISECPPEYLDVLGEFKAWQAGKDREKGTEEGNKKAGYNAKDAARCAGWAARIRSGYKAPPAATSAMTGDDPPF